MMKVAEAYSEEMFATLSQTLNKQWFIEKLNKSIAIAQQNAKFQQQRTDISSANTSR